MSFGFTAIDFETANHHRGSPCAVGLARVRGDEIVEAVSWLMQPPPQYGGFEPYNVRVHGISARTIATAPAFRSVLPDILSFISSDVVCAHNARFDSAVLAAAAIAVGDEPPNLRYLCTLTAARRCLDLPSYRLPFVADALGVRLGAYHDPGDDSRAVALLVPRLAAQLSVSSLEQMVAITQTAPTPKILPTIDRPHPKADPDHPLWGRVIVFTGALSSMSRQLAHEECIRMGALPEKIVTKRTNVLVVGDLDPARMIDVLDGKPSEGIGRIRAALARCGGRNFNPGFQAATVRILVAAHAATGDAAGGLEACERALGLASTPIWDPEFHRARALFLLSTGADVVEVHEALRVAGTVARRQCAAGHARRIEDTRGRLGLASSPAP